MERKDTTPPANSPDVPLGDRGRDDKTWTPPPGEQGISNREDDEAAESDTEDQHGNAG